MDGDTTIVVAGTPDEGEPGGELEPWQLELSEVIRTELQSGFNSLRAEFNAELTTLRQSNSDLLQANANLTAQITAANQTLMDKIAALTPPPSPPIVEVVTVETPPPAPENVGEENPAVETSEVETPPPATSRKRRLL